MKSKISAICNLKARENSDCWLTENVIINKNIYHKTGLSSINEKTKN